MKKASSTLNGLISSYPDAEVITQGAGPYWRRATLNLSDGRTISVGNDGSYSDSIGDASVIKLVLIGE